MSSQGVQMPGSAAQSTLRTVTTLGLPTVKVPVLSKAKALIRLSVSRKAPPLIRTPLRAALLIALTRLTGVLITNAHGQAMTNTSSAR